MKDVHAITPFTLLDFPGELACIVWFPKCNLRCVYCHNPDIVNGQGDVELETYTAFLKSRVGKLTGVVFSGGEPTLNAQLPNYAAIAKELGFKVKLDTNGSRPLVVSDLIARNLLDYVALDFKCPPEKAKELIGTDQFVEAFAQTLPTLVEASKKGALKLEVRTTFHTDYLDEADLNKMIQTLESVGYNGIYYLQNIISVGEQTLGNVAKPTKKILVDEIKVPNGFAISFRNFVGMPERIGAPT